MKNKILLALLGSILIGAGCVSTVNDRTSAGIPLVRDKVAGRYERPVDQVFQAAKDVVREMGAPVNETTLYGQTNVVKTVEGRVNERKVWVRVEGVDPKVTEVTVQTRTPGGLSDIDLAHEIEKQIALKLVR